MSDHIDLGDESSVTTRQRELKVRENAQDTVLRVMMEQKEIRKWMFELLSRCHMFQTSFSKSALEMAFMEGARNVGLQVQNDLVRVSPELYLKMMKEQQESKDD